MNSELTPHGPDWRTRIRDLEAQLDELRPRLIDSETELADQLAAINAFEFQLRSRLQAKVRRLNELQAEIDDYRRQIRRMQFALGEWDDDDPERPPESTAWDFTPGEGAAASGNYRYHAEQPSPPPSVALSAELAAQLKALYRTLARRFHPDLADNETDRAYRTNLMMAINTAYASGDLERLQQLATEPDSITLGPQTDEARAEALRREIERCELRLAEIDRELRALAQHESSILMRRMERAAAVGRDMLAELAADLQQQITEKLVERDVLQSQLEEMEAEGIGIESDLSDLVYDLGLEQAGSDDLFSEYDAWRVDRQERRFGSYREDDDILDDSN